MCEDLTRALHKGIGDDMTCLFLDAMELMQGSDVNFELVSSSSIRPLRLLYEYNFSTESQCIIIVHTQMDGLLEYIERDGQTAMEIAKQAKKDLVDSKIVSSENVVILVDLNKEQIV